ncbi:hypothetical protein M427DRAFT_33567 [Gonapodya prolifera JEL478]|uniref:Uncharacterized protein n=1 Tax=Gonapodya prolifera (strain JEL478) TaxID=1344416 RepID=A0A139AB88_GONPJ|nr:hypothetical protein M427DRAFT_33567 [Gonapodya prolifera JEL478]|eukprot:KXS13919.1 hypothetical protein M427DRAFT_33567 [Gonapodya prolifera JEL478]
MPSHSDLARIVQKDASVQIATTIRDYLTTANVMLQAAVDVISTGLIDILDWDVTKNVPLAMPDPFLMLGAVNLAMSFPVFNPTGRYVGILTEQFIVQNLCTVLDSMRANATPNTLHYILKEW